MEGPPKKSGEVSPKEKAEKSTREDFKLEDVDTVETAKGSTYRYLQDGTTQRFKKVEGKQYEPQYALVYVPDYAWVQKHAPPHILEKLGENEQIYEETILEYVQDPWQKEKKSFIVDKAGKKIETNEEIEKAGKEIYLALATGETTDFFIPIWHKPEMGFMTFDTRKYKDEKTGKLMRERHLGNKVVRINLKNQSQ